MPGARAVFSSRWALANLLMFLVAGAAHAQQPPPLPKGPSPLLYVRFSGPAGLHATFYQGQATVRAYPAPVTVGLRAGYIYRVKLSGPPGQPGGALYPSLEVRGTLSLPPKLSTADYPAPFILTEQDIERAQAGSLVTKVIYLEDPDKAVPAATSANELLETEILPQRDPLAVARDLGRPMLIVRLGERDFRDEELAREAIPGTILLPGEKVLGTPRYPPFVPWACAPFFDPRLGPRPATEECLHDGGDKGLPVGYDRNGQLAGLDPADTVAEFADSHGRRGIAVSNRVCVCVPRFAIIRNELPLGRYDTVLSPGDTMAVQGQDQLLTRMPSKLAQQNQQIGAMKGRFSPSATVATQGTDRIVHLEVLYAQHLDTGPETALCIKALDQLNEVQRALLARQIEFARRLIQQYGTRGVDQTQGTSVVGRVEGLDLVTAVAETRDLTCICHEPPRPPDKPLALCKWADVQAAKVGDVVTFYLKYSNQGGQPITDVAVSDSLTGRLEYVPGSAQTDRNAVFTTQQNEAGSVILRWEISGRLLPGHSGVVKFQARIR